MAKHGHGHQHKLKHGHGPYAGQFIGSALANYSHKDLIERTLKNFDLLKAPYDPNKGKVAVNIDDCTVVDVDENLEEKVEEQQATLIALVRRALSEAYYLEHKQAILGLVTSSEGMLDYYGINIEDDLIHSGSCDGMKFLNDSLETIASRVHCPLTELVQVQKGVIGQLSPLGLLCCDGFQYRKLIAHHYFTDVVNESFDLQNPRRKHYLSMRSDYENSLGNKAQPVFSCLRALTTEQEVRRELYQGTRTFRGGITSAKQVAKFFRIDLPTAETALKISHDIYNTHAKTMPNSVKKNGISVRLRWNEKHRCFHHLLTDEELALKAQLEDKRFGRVRGHIESYLNACAGWKKSRFIQDHEGELNKDSKQKLAELAKNIQGEFKGGQQSEDSHEYMDAVDQWLLLAEQDKQQTDAELDEILGSGKGSKDIDPRQYLKDDPVALNFWLMLKRLNEYEGRKDSYARIAQYMANFQEEHLRSGGSVGRKRLTAQDVAAALGLNPRKTQRWISSMVIEFDDGKTANAKTLAPRSEKDMWKNYIREILVYPDQQQMLEDNCSHPERGLTPTAVWEVLLHSYGARETLPDGSHQDAIAQKTVYNYYREVQGEINDGSIK